MTNPTPDQIEAFKTEWGIANSEGDLGNRVRRGLTAAAGVTPQEPGSPRVETLGDITEVMGQWRADGITLGSVLYAAKMAFEASPTA